MGRNSTIEWCDHTFNPWIGCTKVSPGCDHCYAQRTGARLKVQWGPGQPRRPAAASTWRQPLAWDRRAAREGTRRQLGMMTLWRRRLGRLPTPEEAEALHCCRRDRL